MHGALLLWAAVNSFAAKGPFAISADAPLEVPVSVADVGRLTNITVAVTLHHPHAGALRVSLTAPDGRERLLFDRPSLDAAGLEDITFSDAARALPPKNTDAGAALHDESYLPAEKLSAFAGAQIRGVWTLRVDDRDGSGAGTLESWSMRISYAPNRAPVAVCQSVTVNADANSCDAAASVDSGTFDPDHDELTVTVEPAGPYAPGTRLVKLTAADPYGESNSCTATVTVVDVTPPVIHCNAQETIQWDELPATFTATATDACDSPAVRIRGYQCWRLDESGTRIETRETCVVGFGGAALTIRDAGRRNSTIEWTVVARDAAGNAARETCKVDVLYPRE